MKKVEQVTQKGKVVIDFDNKLNPSEIKGVMSKYFVLKNSAMPLEAERDSRKFILCVKNITYLGHPHLAYKKRIQISGKWKATLRKPGTLLIGIYNYGKHNIFVIFDTAKYMYNSLNNSSAHVHTIDLLKGIEYGIFEKVDMKGNKIAVIREDKFDYYINNFVNTIKNELPQEIKLIDDFGKELPKKLYGVNAYNEMINNNFRNAFQSEWPAFYLEYKFEKYINENKLGEICEFVSNKGDDDLDFDLNFANKHLGDLKMHSVDSGQIMGNDKEDFFAALKLYGKFWYVVFSHSTVKDSECGHVVTKHWNSKINEAGGNKALDSYSKKMKNEVSMVDVVILEINKNNVKYLTDLRQGRNSNGRARALKIKIGVKDLDNLLIFKRSYQ